MSSYKKFIIALVALLTLVAAGFSVYLLMKPRPTPSPADGQTIKLEGSVVCLPHKNTGGPQTLECASGLQVGQNDYYGLRQLPTDQFVVGRHLSVEGVFKKATDDERYRIIGNIEVTSAQQR